jgi:hypothetical protein
LPQQDLESMLDRMEDMARNGARQDAEAMLDEMQTMFENMRGADAQEDQASREMRKQMSELGKLLRDQQALRDDTFRQDQREQLGRDAPQGQGDQPGQSLAERQRALGERLAELQQRLKSLGMKGEKGFDDAQGDMKEAEGDLEGDGQGDGQGDKSGGGIDEQGRTGKGRAVDAQGRALEALRQGAQGLQQQAQGAGQGGGGYRATSRRPGAGGPGRDPLGREAGDRGGALEGALNGGPDVAERARRVLEELRRRLADPGRPEEERDYFERLLKRD